MVYADHILASDNKIIKNGGLTTQRVIVARDFVKAVYVILNSLTRPIKTLTMSIRNIKGTIVLMIAVTSIGVTMASQTS